MILKTLLIVIYVTIPIVFFKHSFSSLFVRDINYMTAAEIFFAIYFTCNIAIMLNKEKK